MKIKKNIGKSLLILTTLMITAGTASAALIGTEEMPESIKKLR